MGDGPGDPPTKEELKQGLAIALKQGRITQAEYNTTLTYLDHGNAGVVGKVLWNNKVDIVTTIVGARAFGGIIKLGWTKWLNTGNWWRYGKGPHNGQMVKRLACGSHPKYIDNVPKWLQPINKWLRSLGNGHKNF